jgi:hypothetical protein
MSETNETDLIREIKGHVVFPDDTVENQTPGNTYFDFTEAEVKLVESTSSDGAKRIIITIPPAALEKLEFSFNKLAQFTFIQEVQSS